MMTTMKMKFLKSQIKKKLSFMTDRENLIIMYIQPHTRVLILKTRNNIGRTMMRDQLIFENNLYAYVV